ncbi:hypothetical protein [Sciscionella marina]|uniref:hypothetical protein n=1 Tax=Sciscionella marina TaxID=508770 RepID=UPI00036E73F2|nr:hypothetical protein [Sciscionella marina]
MISIYGGHALAMGLGYLTSGPVERARWTRLGLAIDTPETLVGITRLIRGHMPSRVVISMIPLTGSYAAIGAAEVFTERSPDFRGTRKEDRRTWAFARSPTRGGTVGTFVGGLVIAY